MSFWLVIIIINLTLDALSTKKLFTPSFCRHVPLSFHRQCLEMRSHLQEVNYISFLFVCVLFEFSGWHWVFSLLLFLHVLYCILSVFCFLFSLFSVLQVCFFTSICVCVCVFLVLASSLPASILLLFQNSSLQVHLIGSKIWHCKHH